MSTMYDPSLFDMSGGMRIDSWHYFELQQRFMLDPPCPEFDTAVRRFVKRSVAEAPP